jgi:hypothetical protein
VIIGVPQLQQPPVISALVRKDTELVIGGDHSSSRECSVVPLDVTSGGSGYTTTAVATTMEDARRVTQTPPRKGHYGLYRDFEVTQSHASISSSSSEQEDVDDGDERVSGKKPLLSQQQQKQEQQEDNRPEREMLRLLIKSMDELRNLKHNYYEDNELSQQIETQRLLIDGITQRLMELEQRHTSRCCSSCVLF